MSNRSTDPAITESKLQTVAKRGQKPDTPIWYAVVSSTTLTTMPKAYAGTFAG